MERTVQSIGFVEVDAARDPALGGALRSPRRRRARPDHPPDTGDRRADTRRERLRIRTAEPLMELCRSYSEAQQNGPAVPDAQLADIVHYMRAHYSTVTLAELSDVSHYSTAHLSRIIMSGLGKGFRDLLKDHKPEGACTSSMSAIRANSSGPASA